jgi:hypothetical protein
VILRTSPPPDFIDVVEVIAAEAAKSVIVRNERDAVGKSHGSSKYGNTVTDSYPAAKGEGQ